MTTWFTSDLHFGHKNIIKYCGRPFASVEEMNEALVENWNAVVVPDDEVWNLGDVTLGISPGKARQYLRRLRGRHHLICGNHEEVGRRLWDRQALADEEFPVFESLTEGFKKIEVEGQKIVLCHYALREWHHALRGVWHLFGHTHGSLRSFGKSVDVGVDNLREILHSDTEKDGCIAGHRGPDMYRPVSFAEIKAFMDRQPIGPHPAFEGHPGGEA